MSGSGSSGGGCSSESGQGGGAEQLQEIAQQILGGLLGNLLGSLLQGGGQGSGQGGENQFPTPPEDPSSQFPNLSDPESIANEFGDDIREALNENDGSSNPSGNEELSEEFKQDYTEEEIAQIEEARKELEEYSKELEQYLEEREAVAQQLVLSRSKRIAKKKISKRLNNKLANHYSKYTRPKNVQLRKFAYHSPVDLFHLNGKEYRVLESVGRPFGCLGEICDYELGRFDTNGIASAKRDKEYSFCRRVLGTGTKEFECWDAINGATVLGIELQNNYSLSKAERARVFVASLKYANINLEKEVRKIYKSSRNPQQRAALSRDFGGFFGGNNGYGGFGGGSRPPV